MEKRQKCLKVTKSFLLFFSFFFFDIFREGKSCREKVGITMVRNKEIARVISWVPCHFIRYTVSIAVPMTHHCYEPGINLINSDPFAGACEPAILAFILRHLDLIFDGTRARYNCLGNVCIGRSLSFNPRFRLVHIFVIFSNLSLSSLPAPFLPRAVL